MILSHKHKYIFVKTRKTAGTSVEILLSEHCGENDIITRITPEDELLRNEWGGRGPQNYDETRFSRKIPILRKINLYSPKPKFYNHMPATEIRKAVESTVWNTYYKFTIVRNPLEVIISQYNYRKSKGKIPSSMTLGEYIYSGRAKMNWEIYTENNRILVDKIIFYESLEKGLNEVLSHLGIPVSNQLPKAKTKYRKTKNSNLDILSDSEKMFIRELCKYEMEEFGY